MSLTEHMFDMLDQLSVSWQRSAGLATSECPTVRQGKGRPKGKAKAKDKAKGSRKGKINPEQSIA